MAMPEANPVPETLNFRSKYRAANCTIDDHRHGGRCKRRDGRVITGAGEGDCYPSSALAVQWYQSLAAELRAELAAEHLADTAAAFLIAGDHATRVELANALLAYRATQL